MFESWLEESLGDPGALLHLASDTMIGERLTGCRRLLVAAAWADCHGAPDDREPGPSSALVDQWIRPGGMGTPLVSQDCAAELGLALQTSIAAARTLIADVLTIRHRLPLLWRRVQAGEVWAWKAAQIARRTRHLGGLSSWVLDRQVTPMLESMAWGRFLDVLDAALLHVDEASYRQRAEDAAGQRDVCSYRGEHGLRTLVARAEAGDVLAFEALVARVAACLADDGDDDPVAVRRSKALGVIAHQARLRDLLARHADHPDDPGHPEQRVAAHQADPTDPWAIEELPPAGWQSERHGNYHQPTLTDPTDLQDCQTSRPAPTDDDGWHEEPPVDDTDQAWHHQQLVGALQHGSEHGSEPVSDPDATAEPAVSADPVRDQRGGCPGCGSTFDLRPLSKAELTASRTRAVVHVHLTDQTLIDQHGVLRTADGPITLDQFRRWLTDSDTALTIRPVLDPAAMAPVDSYEIPQRLREAVHTRHPGSVWPFSPTTQISTGGRLDLDHTRPYRTSGPPGQTATANLGPLTRSEHRAKTHHGWQARQPHPGHHLWRSPHGWISLVTNQGSLLLGDNPFAHQIWQAADQY